MMSLRMSFGRIGVFSAVVMVALVSGCGSDPQSEDVVATYRGGSLSFAEVEYRVRAEIEAGNTPVDWLTAYREAAEAMTVERNALKLIVDREAALDDLGLDYQLLVRQATLEHYLKDLEITPVSIEESAVQQYFDDHPDVFIREGRRFVWHLFRRHVDPDDPKATLDLLSNLRKRCIDGEPFMLLAREYSQSENQALDGRLGWVSRGKMPPDLEEIVFGLEEDEVSEPLKVAGGAMLVYVSHVVPFQEFELEDVRLPVSRRLQSLAFESKMREQITTQPPEGSTILEPAELRQLIRSVDSSSVVLEIADFRLTAEDLLNQVAELPVQPLAFVSPIEQVEEVYQQQVDRQLLYQQAVDLGFTEDPENRRAIESLLRIQGNRLLIDRQVRSLMMDKIEVKALEDFFENNIYLYQSPLQIRVSTLAVSVGDEPVAQLTELERLRDQMASGVLTIKAASELAGGFVTESKWMGPEELEAIEPKVVAFLLQLGGPGFSHPYQLNHLFQILRVEDWQEPRALPFKEVEDRVRHDYCDRNLQDLYSAVKNDVLADVSFQFNAESVLRRLEVDVVN